MRASSTVKAWSSQKASQKRASFEVRNLGNQLLRDPANVLVAAIGKLRGHGVRSQQRGHDPHRTLGVEPGHHAQHAQLRVTLQSIAGLGFCSRRAGAKHPVAMTARFGQQFLFRGGARRTHCVQNPAAGRSNLLIAGAGNALLEFGGAVARKHQVRVRIDKTRRHAAALAHRPPLRRAAMRARNSV